MITRYNKLTLMAGFALAMAFTFSCSSDVESPTTPPNGNSDVGSSSDGGGSSDGGDGSISSSSNGDGGDGSISSSSNGDGGDGSISSSSGSGSNSSVTVNSSSSAQSKCGSVLYNPATQFCIADKMYDKCNNSEYNPATQVCSGGNTVYTPTCAADLSAFCPGTNWSQVKWNENPEKNNNIAQGCYWVEDWYASNGNRGFANVTNFLINGVSKSKNSNKDDWSANKIDGGIYIYLPSTTPQSNATGSIYTGSKPPLCAVGYKLSCSIPTQWGANSAISPTLTCNYDSPSNETYLGAPNWDDPAAGNYNNISVSATCGTSGTLTANCGNLRVLTCQIASKLEDVCPNVNSSNWKTAIKWDGPPAGNPKPSGCYYATSIYDIDKGGFNTDSYMVNGWEFTSSTRNPNVQAVVDKLDGGYYIYLPGTVWDLSIGTSTKPACAN
jgi:hypothetical protein